MFPSARWKAYLHSLRFAEDSEKSDTDKLKQNIYRTIHSQGIWFHHEDPKAHNLAALEHLERCNMLLGECTAIVDTLEETLARTPKPSQVLDWTRLW